MKKIETFIFIHDQEILLDFLNKNRFKNLSNLKYVFLSNRPSDKISHLSNVIIAKNLPINIEEYPKFTSFTGWYALYKNNLIDSEYVNFFEYDTNMVENFNDVNLELISKNPDFIGYFPMLARDIVYIEIRRFADELINSIKVKSNFDVYEYINKRLLEDQNLVWSSSSNSTWKTSELFKYIDWFSQFIDDIKNNIYCGHMHERSLSFYYFINNLNVVMTNGLMTHLQLNTHGTSPLPEGRFNELYTLLK